MTTGDSSGLSRRAVLGTAGLAVTSWAGLPGVVAAAQASTTYADSALLEQKLDALLQGAPLPSLTASPIEVLLLKAQLFSKSVGPSPPALDAGFKAANQFALYAAQRSVKSSFICSQQGFQISPVYFKKSAAPPSKPRILNPQTGCWVVALVTAGGFTQLLSYIAKRLTDIGLKGELDRAVKKGVRPTVDTLAKISDRILHNPYEIDRIGKTYGDKITSKAVSAAADLLLLMTATALLGRSLCA